MPMKAVRKIEALIKDAFPGAQVTITRHGR